MGILGRLGGVVSGVLNNLLDQVEDPVTKLNQITEKTQKGVAEIRKAVAQLMAQKSRVAEERTKIGSGIERLEQVANIAVAQQNRDTALQAIQKKNELKIQFDNYTQQIATLDSQIKEMSERLQQAEATLNETKHQSVLLKSKAISNKASSTIFNPEGIQNDFERIRERIESASSYISATTQMLSSDATIALLERQVGLSSSEWELAQLEAKRQLQLPPAAAVAPVAPAISISTTISGNF